MPKEPFWVYGEQKALLMTLVAEAERENGCALRPYGENKIARMDALAHLSESLQQFDQFFKLAVEESEMPPLLLARLKGTDAEAYEALAALGFAVTLAKGHEADAKVHAGKLADALADINNELGETPFIKKTILTVDRLMTEYKGTVE